MRRTTDTERDDARAGALAAAIRWLRHPVSLAAIAVLLLNDHVLKAEFGTWWTGKLSDVAGLVFAPALVAVVVAAFVAAVARLAAGRTPRRSTPCRSNPRRTPRLTGSRRTQRPATVAAASLAVVGVLFVAAKATAVGAATASSLLGHLVGPSLIRADPTDLLALPALAVAWLSFRASSHQHTPRAVRRRGASRLATVATLAIATGAVLASSSQLPARPAAVAVHGTNGVVTVTYEVFYGAGSPSIIATTDGMEWGLRCGESGPRECADKLGDYVPELTPVCVPSQPKTCFRPQPDAIAVDRSDDGGATWHQEWGLSATERERLSTALGIQSIDEYLRTMGVRILDLPTGFVVIAANGLDGLAVRHADGTWERRGLLDSQCCSGYPFPPIDVSVEPPFDLGTSAGAASALAAWCLAFVIVVLGTRSPRPAPGGLADRIVYWVQGLFGGVLVAAGLACLVRGMATSSGLFYLSAHLPPENPGDGFASPGFALFVVTVLVGAIGVGGAVAIVLGSLLFPSDFRWHPRLAVATAAGALAATPVALGVGWTAHRISIIAAATAVAFAVGLAATYVAWRSRADRDASAPEVPAHRRGVTFEP